MADDRQTVPGTLRPSAERIRQIAAARRAPDLRLLARALNVQGSRPSDAELSAILVSGAGDIVDLPEGADESDFRRSALAMRTGMALPPLRSALNFQGRLQGPPGIVSRGVAANLPTTQPVSLGILEEAIRRQLGL